MYYNEGTGKSPSEHAHYERRLHGTLFRARAASEPRHEVNEICVATDDYVVIHVLDIELSVLFYCVFVLGFSQLAHTCDCNLLKIQLLVMFALNLVVLRLHNVRSYSMIVH